MGRRLLRATEWVGWPRIWVLPPRLAHAATISSDSIPWVPDIAALPSGVYAIGPAVPRTRAIPAACAANDHEPWAVYRRRPLGAIHRLRSLRLDTAVVRDTALTVAATRRLPGALPELVGNAERWRDHMGRELAALREDLAVIEAIERHGWDACTGDPERTAVVPLALAADRATVHLAEPPRGRSTGLLVSVLAHASNDRDALLNAAARAARRRIPAVPEALFLAWIFSGGAPAAARAALDDLLSCTEHFRAEWDGPVPEGPNADTVRRLVRRRQALCVGWVGAMHGLAPGSGITPASWLGTMRAGLWRGAFESEPCDPGQWSGRCERAEGTAVRLAIGLGVEELPVLRAILDAFAAWPQRLADRGAHEGIGSVLALARAGADAAVFARHDEWWRIAHAIQHRPDRARRMLKHPWFGSEHRQGWVGQRLIELPESLLNWAFALPARLAPNPEASDSQDVEAVVGGILAFLTPGDDDPRRTRFLLDHGLALTAELARRIGAPAPDGASKCSWIDRIEDALLLAVDWEQSGFEDAIGVFVAGLDRAEVEASCNGCFPAVVLSGGSVPRLFELAGRLPPFEDAHVRHAWELLRDAPRVREALLAQPPSRVSETVARLEDVARAVQLCPDAARCLEEGPGDESLHPGFDEVVAVLPDRASDLVRLQWLQRELGEEVGPSRSLRRVLRGVAAAGGDTAATVRAVRRLTRRLDESLRAGELARIQHLVGDALSRKVSGWLRGLMPASAPLDDTWRHATRLGMAAEDNRRSFKRLLRAESRGEAAAWIRNHPANRRFLARLARAGVDTAAWLAGVGTRREVAGETLDIRVEDRPLEVLKMGTLFGTCLGAGEFNSHAAVANALDLNKRVIYVWRGGCVVARKLVAVLLERGDDGTERPVLVGYRVYGDVPAEDDDANELKLTRAVHEVCREWAGRCGIPLGIRRGVEPERLIARAWYDDGQTEWTPRSSPGPKSRLKPRPAPVKIRGVRSLSCHRSGK